MMKRTVLSVALMASVVTGCSLNTDIREDDVYRPLLISKPDADLASASSYVRIITPESRTTSKLVTVNHKSVSVMDAITDVLPELNVVPRDVNVDLRREVAVYANKMPAKDYLDMLTGLTDYYFEIRGNTIHASSMRSGQWNLAALVSKRKAVATVGKSNLGAAATPELGNADSAGGSSGGSGGGADETNESTVSITNDDDAWEQIIEGARSIVGVVEEESVSITQTQDSSGSSAFPGLVDPFVQASNRAKLQPYVSGVRRFGIITASGAPSRVTLLDKWLQNLSHNAQRQVRLDIRAFDVSLKDARGRGIDWTALYGAGTSNSVAFSGSSPVTIPGAGTWSIAANAISGNKWSFETLFDFLGTYGEVNIMNQPSLTVVNGSTAMISNGDMFSFISSIARTQDAQGIQTVTPVVSQMRVGLSLSVTPRVLDDDRILIEVVPVLSSLQGFSDFSVGDFSFSTPNVALQELSTHVIARSGETVQLGGLITRRIEEQMSRIPFADGDGGMANFLFSSVRNALDRRELVLAITPKLLDV